MPYILHYICHISVFEVQRKDLFCSNKKWIYITINCHMSHILYHILLSHMNLYLISKLPYCLVICCVAEILSPRFVSAPRFVETRWTMLRDASNKQMPRTSKTCVEPNAEFSNIQPTKYMEKKPKFHLQQEKHCHLPEVSEFWVPSHVSSVEPCRTLFFSSPSVFSDSLSIPWKFHPLYFLLFFKPSAFDSMQNLVLLGSSSIVTLTWSIGSRHTLPLICWTKSPAWTKRAKKDGKIPSCICKMDGGSSILWNHIEKTYKTT